MHLIIVGAGDITKQVLRRVGESWKVTIIDARPQPQGLQAERPADYVEGDASSKVVLESAGLPEADALLLAGDDDIRNLESARIAKEMGVERVIAIATDPAQVPAYRQLKIPVFSPAQLASRQVELLLEERRVTSKTLSEGRTEAFEFYVSPSSPVRDMKPADLERSNVRVLAVLRSGNLMMGADLEDVTIAPADLVTLFGPANEVPDLVELFTAARARFPRDHGKRVAVVLATSADMGKSFGEAVTLVRASRASTLTVLHPKADGGGVSDEMASLLTGAELAAEGVKLDATPSDKPRRELFELGERSSIGTIVVPAPKNGSRFASIQVGRAISKARATHTPVLFARGHHSYERILVAARRTPAGEAAARAAIDIADLAKAELTALAVESPEFARGMEENDARGSVRWVRYEASLQGVDAKGEHLEGNPVRAFREASEGMDLVVLGISPSANPFRTRIAQNLVKDLKASVLVVPSRKDEDG